MDIYSKGNGFFPCGFDQKQLLVLSAKWKTIARVESTSVTPDG